MGNNQSLTIINQPQAPVTVNADDLAKLAIEAAALLATDSVSDNNQLMGMLTLKDPPNNDKGNIAIIQRDVPIANQNKFSQRYHYVFGAGFANPPAYNGLFGEPPKTNTLFSVVKANDFGDAALNFVAQINLPSAILAATQTVIKDKIQLDAQNIMQACASSESEGWAMMDPGTAYDVFPGKSYQLQVDYSIYYALGRDSGGEQVLFIQTNMVVYTVNTLGTVSGQLNAMKDLFRLRGKLGASFGVAGALGTFHARWLTPVAAALGWDSLKRNITAAGVNVSGDLQTGSTDVSFKCVWLQGTCFDLCGKVYMAYSRMSADAKPTSIEQESCGPLDFADIAAFIQDI